MIQLQDIKDSLSNFHGKTYTHFSASLSSISQDSETTLCLHCLRRNPHEPHKTFDSLRSLMSGMQTFDKSNTEEVEFDKDDIGSHVLCHVIERRYL